MTDDVVVMVCPGQAQTPEQEAALAELARAAIRMEEDRRAALPPAERAAEDARRAEGQARLRRIQERARGDR